jgi:DnaJ-class molecular chaperone
MLSQQQRTCAKCRGTGYSGSGDCTKRVKETIQVNIDKGCPEGILFIYPGMTNEEPGQPPGNLIFKIAYKPHDIFKVIPNTLDMEVKLNINLYEALSGFERTFLHPSGHTILLKSSKPLKPSRYCVTSQGISMKHMSGNLYVNLEVEFPKSIHNNKTSLQEILGQKNKTEKLAGKMFTLESIIKRPTDISRHVQEQNRKTYECIQEDNNPGECRQS